MAAPVVQSLDQILAQIQPGYAGQENVINQQISAEPGRTQAITSGLETAKSNAFRDINTNANSKGVAFSGIPSSEQTRYVGEKYLPALSEAQQSGADRVFKLQQALAGLDTEKRNLALSTQQGQQKQLDDYNAAELAYQREMAQIQLQYQQDMQKLAAQNSYQSGGQTNLTIKKNAAGGWDVLENGKKSSNYDLAGYARLTGANIVDLLRNGDAKDRQAAQWYLDKIRKYGTKDQAKYLEELKKDRSTAFYLGG